MLYILIEKNLVRISEYPRMPKVYQYFLDFLCGLLWIEVDRKQFSMMLRERQQCVY